MKITAFDPETKQAYYVEASLSAMKKYNNYALVSRGWTVGEDLPRTTFQRLRKVRISDVVYKHSGCLSRCTERGHSTCQW